MALFFVFFILLFTSSLLLSLPYRYFLSSCSTFYGASIDKWGVEALVSLEEGSRDGYSRDSVSVRAIFGAFLLPLRGCPLTRYESEEASLSRRTVQPF